MPKFVKELIEIWSQECVDDLSHKGRMLWYDTPGFIVWSVWMEQNGQIFNGSVPDLKKWPDRVFPFYLDGSPTPL